MTLDDNCGKTGCICGHLKCSFWLSENKKCNYNESEIRYQYLQCKFQILKLGFQMLKSLAICGSKIYELLSCQWRQRGVTSMFVPFVLASWLVRSASWLRTRPLQRGVTLPRLLQVDRPAQWHQSRQAAGIWPGTVRGLTERGNHGGGKAENLPEGHQVPVRGSGRVGAALAPVLMC